jgi:hypothetical protein
MTNNITDKINSALSPDKAWDKDMFLDCLNQCCNLIQEGTLDWDEYSGEKWARVLVHNEPVFYLYKDSPLAFVQETFLNRIMRLKDLSYIVFKDVNEEIYELDAHFFDQWSQGSAESGGLMNHPLSVSDIWWATVS